MDVDDDHDLDLGDVEVNGEVKVYVDFAADVGGDVEARSFKDITLWTRLVYTCISVKHIHEIGDTVRK